MTKHQRYNRSPKGRARMHRYRATEKGRASERRGKVRLRVAERAARIEQIEKELTK